MTGDPGPYMNEDGDWWVPVEGHSLAQARALVLGCLYYSIPSEGRLAYLGREMAWLDSEHDPDSCGEDCESNRRLLAWHFEERQAPWM